jgi:hypothetical protein
MDLLDLMLTRIQINVDKVKLLEELKLMRIKSEKFDGLISLSGEINTIKRRLEIMDKIDQRLELVISQYY